MTSQKVKNSEDSQYSLKNVHRYERIFGPTWVSTGSEATTKELYLQVGFKPRQKVLDIGCGLGGSAFYVARQYGCFVTGVDMSPSMISLCKDRVNREEKVVRERLSFEVADIFDKDYPANEFDVIYSRDAIMHIEEKEALFKRIWPWLKPGGTLFITEYVRQSEETSPALRKHLDNKGYYLKTLTDYQETLEKAGFRDAKATEYHDIFKKLSEEELKYFCATKEAFLMDYSQEDYDWIYNNWRTKIDLIDSGDQSWAFFSCKK